eukprot:Lithocolla_globosa_v1_NODE_186_length_5337_cov_5.779712.p4 type:complete len:181 gc:universal NODE_186_length_5337_cov_5.779712:445-987(+)
MRNQSFWWVTWIDPSYILKSLKKHVTLKKNVLGNHHFFFPAVRRDRALYLELSVEEEFTLLPVYFWSITDITENILVPLLPRGNWNFSRIKVSSFSFFPQNLPNCSQPLFPSSLPHFNLWKHPSTFPHCPTATLTLILFTLFFPFPLLKYVPSKEENREKCQKLLPNSTRRKCLKDPWQN